MRAGDGGPFLPAKLQCACLGAWWYPGPPSLPPSLTSPLSVINHQQTLSHWPQIYLSRMLPLCRRASQTLRFLLRHPSPLTPAWVRPCWERDALALFHLRTDPAQVSTEPAHCCCLIFSLGLNASVTERAGTSGLRLEGDLVDSLLSSREREVCL